MDAPRPRDFHDLIDWLRGIEERAGRLYRSAATMCAADVSFSRFLAGLAEEESSHAGYMAAAGEQLGHLQDRPRLDIVLDEETRHHVVSLQERFERLLERPSVSKKDVLEYVARMETAEWNPLFLYVAEEYRWTGREGERAVGEIQAHLQRIQDFIDAQGRDLRPSVDVATLPHVSEPRFLVVDDSGPLRKLLAALLRRQGAVDTAMDAREGLDQLKSHFHDAVISDIQMPGVDGLEFYRRAVEYDGRLQRRFLFCTAQVTPEVEDCAKRNHVSVLTKPFGLDQFSAAVAGIVKAPRAARSAERAGPKPAPGNGGKHKADPS
jgi:CheY-like chemotaxis protein/rubrerythrin